MARIASGAEGKVRNAKVRTPKSEVALRKGECPEAGSKERQPNPLASRLKYFEFRISNFAFRPSPYPFRISFAQASFKVIVRLNINLSGVLSASRAK